jgi:hypothetical protein
MRHITKAEFDLLTENAVKATTSGHPFLDSRWFGVGENDENKYFRCPYYRFAKELAKLTEAKFIVELGINGGHCCAHWADSSPSTTVIGVDIHKDSERPAIMCREVETVFPNFKYLRGWTWDRVKDVAAMDRKIDILFIDSWHEYHYLARDWNDYMPMLHDKSIVLIDDLHMGGVWHGWNELTKIYKNHFADSAVMNPACPIGLINYDGKPTILPYEKQAYMP